MRQVLSLAHVVFYLFLLSAWTKLFSMNFDKVKKLCQSQKPS
jgi:hypothetical protein